MSDSKTATAFWTLAAAFGLAVLVVLLMWLLPFDEMSNLQGLFWAVVIVGLGNAAFVAIMTISSGRRLWWSDVRQMLYFGLFALGLVFAWFAFNYIAVLAVMPEERLVRVILAVVSLAVVGWLAFLAKEKFDQ